jgi:hypothetical protein
MAKTMDDLEVAYRRQGWKGIAAPDGSISFERDAKPSVVNRKQASAVRCHIRRRSGQSVTIIRKDAAKDKAFRA